MKVCLSPQLKNTSILKVYITRELFDAIQIIRETSSALFWHPSLWYDITFLLFCLLSTRRFLLPKPWKSELNKQQTVHVRLWRINPRMSRIIRIIWMAPFMPKTLFYEKLKQKKATRPNERWWVFLERIFEVFFVVFVHHSHHTYWNSVQVFLQILYFFRSR